MVDLCFIIDSSGSIRDNNPANGPDNWQLQLQFLSDLVGAFTVGQDATRVGAIVFSERVLLEFPLNAFDTRSEVQRALVSIAYLGQTTNTPEAFIQTRQQCFNPSNGDRPEVQNLAIIVTDGLPFPASRRSPAIDEARILRDTGVTIIPIGITDNIDADFLRDISSPPQIEGMNFFTATDFAALQQITRTVVEGTCEVLLPGTWKCVHFGVALLCVYVVPVSVFTLRYINERCKIFILTMHVANQLQIVFVCW